MSSREKISYKTKELIARCVTIILFLAIIGLIIFTLVSIINNDNKRNEKRIAEINSYVEKYPYVYPVVVVGNAEDGTINTLALAKFYVNAYERGKWVALNDSKQDDIAAFRAAIDEKFGISNAKIETKLIFYKVAFDNGKAEGDRLRNAKP